MSLGASEDELVILVGRGDENALAELFAIHRDRLWKLVAFRMDTRLRGRVDVDDVLQEVWLSASQRISHFLTDASRSVFVWFRLITCQTLVDLHRRHLGAKKRSAACEFSIETGWRAASTSSSLYFHLQGTLTSPSEAAVRAERASQVPNALEALRDIDREVVALRHFEQLTNRETAQVLGISEQAASDRYIRVLGRLRSSLGDQAMI